MVRTVKVRLELDRDDYKRGLRDVSGEMRTFDGEVRAAGKDAAVMGVEVKSAGTKVEAMGREVDAAAKKTTGLGDEADKAKTKTTGLGEESKKTSDKFKDLDGRLRDAKATVRELSEEFLKGGRSADAFTKLSKAGKDVQELEKLKKAVEDFALEAERVGTKAGSGLVSGLASAFQSMPPQAQAGLAAGIAGAIVIGTPVIGAAVSSAVLLGVGGGALAAGIALAAKDPSVQAAWSNLGNDVKAQLVQAGAVFAPSLVRAADTFGSTMGRIMPNIRADFASLAPLVDRLAAGAGGMVERMMPGLDRLIVAAGPFLNELAAHLPLIGAAISSFFNSIAGGAPGASAFFSDFLHWAEVGIVLLGYLINGLSQTYAALSGVSKIMSGDLSGAATIWEQFLKGKSSSDDLTKGLDGLKDGAGGVVSPLDSAGAAVGRLEGNFRNAIQQVGYFTKSLDSINGGNIALATSQMGAESALATFQQALKDSNGSLDIHTEKGRAAMQAALGLTSATGDLAQKTYEQSGSSTQGAAALDHYKQAMITSMVQSGMTREAAGALADQWLRMPPEASTTVKAPGLPQTKADAAELYRGLKDLDGKTAHIYVTTHYTSTGIPVAGVGQAHADFALGGIRRAAIGMLIPPSDPGTVLTGEPQTGGEVLIPMRGIDQGRAAMLGRTALGGYGLDVVPRQAPGYAAVAGARSMTGGGITNITTVTIPVTAGLGTDGYQVGQQIVDALRPFVQRNGGGSVQMAIVGRQVP